MARPSTRNHPRPDRKALLKALLDEFMAIEDHVDSSVENQSDSFLVLETNHCESNFPCCSFTIVSCPKMLDFKVFYRKCLNLTI